MSVGFVMSGGASLGAVQAGMLRALYERGVEPDVIVGTSVGAINGAYIASRPPSANTAAGLVDVWRGVRRSEIFPFNPASALVGLAGGRNYAVPNGALRRLIDSQLEFDRLEDAPVPLHVVAVDLFTGRERLISRGPALDAILASSAIPGVFAPVEWEDTELIDGGVANNTPISHALELGCDRIYVLSTGTACALPEAPHGTLGMALHAMSLLVQQRLSAEIAELKHDPRVVVLPPPCPITIQPTDFSRADELIARGYEEAVDVLDRPRILADRRAAASHGHGLGDRLAA
ncbi:MAG: patatin-like phospholipase family protein [Actinomycetota bacterium]|nr:patatin-like phospholipase family protein [Actinomycetota bacterium]